MYAGLREHDRLCVCQDCIESAILQIARKWQAHQGVCTGTPDRTLMSSASHFYCSACMAVIQSKQLGQ